MPNNKLVSLQPLPPFVAGEQISGTHIMGIAIRFTHSAYD